MKFTMTLSEYEDNGFSANAIAETARALRAAADRIETITPPKRSCDFIGDYADKHGGWAGHSQTVFSSEGKDIGRFVFKNETP